VGVVILLELMRAGARIGVIALAAAFTFAVIGIAILTLISAICGLVSGRGRDKKEE